MSKEFVDAISIGANIDADKAFKDSISQKVGDALELKRREYSKTFVGNLPQEETDEVWKSLRNDCRERWT